MLEGQIGRFGAFENSSSIDASLAKDGCVVNSIADQTAGRDERAARIYRRNGVAVCQRHDLLKSARNEPVGIDDEPAGMQPVEGRKSGVDFGVSAGLFNSELHAFHIRRFLRVFDDTLGIRVTRIDQ